MTKHIHIYVGNGKTKDADDDLAECKRKGYEAGSTGRVTYAECPYKNGAERGAWQQGWR